MKYYSREEIINKHGKYIPYFSKSEGNTELEKFKNSPLYDSDKYTEYIIDDKFTCFIYYIASQKIYGIDVFNELGELIVQEEDLDVNSEQCVRYYLLELGII